MSCRTKILIAASKLGPTFSISELMVRAWELYPTEFGMREYPYPDSNRLRPRIYGKDGIIDAGWLRWVGDELELTEEGRVRIQDPPKASLSTLDDAAARAIWAARGFR